MDGWIKYMWYRHTMKLYSTLKNNGISMYINGLENMIVNKIKKFQKY